MICYVLLSVVQYGLLPVILPLAAGPGAGSGLTYAAYAAAGIAAPFIGAWSDRRRRNRQTLALGLGLAGLALLAQIVPGGVAQHMATAALVGFGVSAASTVATMLIVEVEPRERWDQQIGALQACMGGGQLVGLIVAGQLGLEHVRTAFLFSGALLLVTVPLALALAPTPAAEVNRRTLVQRPARGGDAVPMGPQRSLHRVTRRALAEIGHNGLTWFLAAWLVSYTAMNGLTVMFAVAMVREYHASATLPTTAYAIGVACSLLLFRRVATWDTRFGAWRVLSAGLWLRALVVGGMAALAALPGGAPVVPILACFCLMQVVWPLFAVSSNSLAVTLAPAQMAESVGLLNAATSVGATIGGALAGVVLQSGFVWLCVVGLLALVLALLLAWHPMVRLDPVAGLAGAAATGNAGGVEQ
jgi:MFS family permease